MKKYILTICTLLLFGLMANAQQRVPAEKQVKWEQFKNAEGDTWRIHWMESNGVPRIISQGLTKAYSGSSESIARQFLGEYRDLFSMKEGLTDLKLKKTQTLRGVRHVTFEQEYKGLAVEGGQYKVHIRENGQIDMANGRYYSNISISTKPTTSVSEAISIAKNDLGLGDSEYEKNTASLVVYPTTDTTFVLAYKTTIFVESPFTDWLYFINANSGEVIEKNNQIMDVTGTGKVYPKHPGNSSLTTKNLYRLNGTGYLTGTYVTVTNDVSSEAYSSTHSFQYSTSNTHFDEVALYYHVDNFRHNFIESLDDGSLTLTQIEAHAHTPFQDFNGDGYIDPNAWFSRSTGDIYFNNAYSPYGVNAFAREDKVVHHEYSHAVIYDIESGISSTYNETGAISEGVPDYLAGSYTQRAKILDYAYSAGERDMGSPSISSYSAYQSSNKQPHAGGEFFSSILWDIRSDIGAGITDFLVYDALYRISGSPDFVEFLEAMLVSDNTNYSGSHSDDIEDAFNAKGIFLPLPLAANIFGPTALYPGQTGIWYASANYGTSPYSYQWQKKNSGQSYWFNVGTNSSYSTSSSVDFQLKLIVTDDDNDTASKTISVDHDGGAIPKRIATDPEIPDVFSLQQNYPNPFNPSTSIKFDIPENAQVMLTVYNVMGQLVATLVNGNMQAGFHELTFNADNLPSGLYIARIQAISTSSGEQFSKELKMQLIK